MENLAFKVSLFNCRDYSITQIWGKLAFSLFFLFIQFSVFGQSFRTATFTGASTDFTAAERFGAAANNTDYYITFDASNLYIGAFRTSGSFDSFDNFTIYLDTDPNATPTSGTGTTTGQLYKNVAGSLPFTANYNIHAEETYKEARSFGSGWSSTISGVTYFTNTTSREVKIPLSSIGNPNSIYLTLWMGFAGGFFSNAPGANIVTSGNPTITSYFGGIGLSSADCIPINITNTPITDVITNGVPASGALYGKVVVSSGTITAANNFNLAPGGSIDVSGGAFDISGRTIHMGGTTIGNGRGTTLNTSGSGVLTTSSTTLFTFNGEGNVTGNALIYNGTATLNRKFTPLASGNFTIGATSVLDLRASSYINLNPPFYAAGAELRYNTGASYGTSTEWTANAASGAGVPSKVTVGNAVANSGINFGSSNQYRQANSNVTISNVTAGSFLTLSTVAGGDLIVGGSFTNNGTFTNNSRAVTLNGTNAQIISGTLNGSGNTNCFPFLTSTNTSGGITLNSPLSITNTLTINGSSTFSLNGNSLSVPNLVGSSTTATINNGHTSTNVTLTVNNTGANTFAGLITNGAAATVALTKSGAGDLSLAGANSYTGTTTLLGGGGKLFLTNNMTLGPLNMLASSSLDLGSGATGFSINFANSNAPAWTGTLTITNWTPSAGKIINVGSAGLTTTQLGQINFDNYGVGSKFAGIEVRPAFLYVTNGAGGGSFNAALNASWLLTDKPGVNDGTESIYVQPGDNLILDVPNPYIFKFLRVEVGLGGTLTMGNHTMTISTSGDFRIAGTVSMTSASMINFSANDSLIAKSATASFSSAGTLNFLGAFSIASNSPNAMLLPNVNLSASVNFGGNSTIQNGSSLNILAGGFVSAKAPFYASGSTLVYNTGGSYDRGAEWSGISGSGYPDNVIIGNGSTTTLLNLKNSTSVQMGGSLNITVSSLLIMDDNTQPKNLTVVKDVIISGTLKLGNIITGPPQYVGDLSVGGNFTRNSGATFIPNQRGVFFNGTSNQTIDGGGSSILFSYFIVNNSGTAPNNIVQLINGADITIDGGIGGFAFQMLDGDLDLNGRKVTFKTYNTLLNNVKIDGSSGSFTRQVFSTGGASSFNFTNPDNNDWISTVTRNSAAASLLSFSSDILVNIIAGGTGKSGVDFGADIGVGFTTINGSLLINSNTFVSVNAPNYDAVSKLIYQTNGSYDRSAEWIRNTAGPGYPGNVIIQDGTTLNFLVGPNTGCAGNLTIGNPTVAGNGVLNLKNYDAAYDLGVGGDIIIGGTSATGSLILSDNIGSDIFIGKGWNRNANGTVNFGAGDGRAVFFNGSADGIITANGGQQFPFVGINKTAITNKITLADNISISDEIKFTTGTIDLGTNNKFLTILSTASKTGRVGQSDAVNTAFVYGAGVAGQFIVQRYVPGVRSWRLLAAPIKPGGGTHSISEAWQERGNGIPGLDYTAANFSNSITTDSITTFGSTVTTGFSTHITGGTLANGFDLSPTNYAGIKYYSSGSWLGPTDVNSTSINSKEGWMLFVRGDRKGFGEITNQYKTPTITTLRPRGQIFIGNKSIISLLGGYTVVGNPYASAVDYNSMSRTGGGWPANPTYYMWDPYLGGTTGQGAFVALTWNTANSNFDRSVPVTGTGTSNIDNRYIPSGAAIMVNFPANGTLTFNEIDKNVTNTTTAFRPARNQLQTVLKTVDTDSTTYISDGTLLLIDPAFSNKVDQNDAVKINNFTENFGLFRNDNILSIERKNLTADYDTVFYNLGQMRLKKYQFQFIADQIEAKAGTALFLEDLYLKSKTALSLNDTSIYNFSITADTGSYARRRFRLLFNPSVVYKNFSTTDVGAMVAIDWKVAEEFNINRYEVERSLDAVSFSSFNTQVSNGNSSTPVSYQILDKDLIPGIYYYRIKSISNNGVIKYSGVAKIKFMKPNPTIYIAPNPVTDNIIQVQMNTVAAGKYAVRLLNNTGQVMQTSTINHTGANSLHTITLNQSIAKGIYQLELSAKGRKTLVLQVMIQ